MIDHAETSGTASPDTLMETVAAEVAARARSSWEQR